MSDKRDYSKEIEELREKFEKILFDESTIMHEAIFAHNPSLRSNVLDAMYEAYNLALSEKEEESKNNAIDFLNFALIGQYRINPNVKETRFLKRGYTEHVIVGDGLTESELYDIFSPTTKIKP